MSKFEDWVDKTLPKQQRLTESVVTTLENLLNSNDIEYLAVSGRTKTKEGALEKIDRKSYKDPANQLTDLSGVRVILYFEDDVSKVSKLIESAFNIDQQNSLNQDEKLSVDQIGYRSVHYVCDLGQQRVELPEFTALSGLKFEVQVRTILQHAWAELAHDRNYKFKGKLPPEIERSLFLYAGMLEIADKGFNELSTEIDEYVQSTHEKAKSGDYKFELDSLSLPEFIENWAERNEIILEKANKKLEYDELLSELTLCGISTADELEAIIPKDYADVCKKRGLFSTTFGYVRDWLLIHDWRHFKDSVDIDWVLTKPHLYDEYFNHEELNEFIKNFEWEGEEEIDYEWVPETEG